MDDVELKLEKPSWYGRCSTMLGDINQQQMIFNCSIDDNHLMGYSPTSTYF
jgi:hypothetical protein